MRLLSFFASQRIYSLFSKCSKRGRWKKEDRERERKEGKRGTPKGNKESIKRRGEEGDSRAAKDRREEQQPRERRSFLQRDNIFHLRDGARDHVNRSRTVSKQQLGDQY